MDTQANNTDLLRPSPPDLNESFTKDDVDDSDYKQTSYLLDDYLKSPTSLTTLSLTKSGGTATTISIANDATPGTTSTFSYQELMLMLINGLNLFMMMGFLGCTGILYVELIQEFQSSKSLMAAIMALPWGMVFGCAFSLSTCFIPRDDSTDPFSDLLYGVTLSIVQVPFGEQLAVQHLSLAIGPWPHSDTSRKVNLWLPQTPISPVELEHGSEERWRYSWQWSVCKSTVRAFI